MNPKSFLSNFWGSLQIGPPSLFGRICRSAPDRVTLGLSKNPPVLNMSICNALLADYKS